MVAMRSTVRLIELSFLLQSLPLLTASSDMSRVGSSATDQPRLWLTTSMLCPSGSSTNAP